MTTSPNTKSGTDQLLPCDTQREHAVIASLVEHGQKVFLAYSEFLDSNHFLGSYCRDAWQRMEEFVKLNQDWGSKEPVYESVKDKPQWKLFLDTRKPWSA